MDYSALKGRIAEVYDTRTAFANAVGMDLQSVCNRLNGKTEIRASEIVTWSKALDVENDIHKYFLCPKS